MAGSIHCFLGYYDRERAGTQEQGSQPHGRQEAECHRGAQQDKPFKDMAQVACPFNWTLPLNSHLAPWSNQLSIAPTWCVWGYAFNTEAFGEGWGTFYIQILTAMLLEVERLGQRAWLSFWYILSTAKPSSRMLVNCTLIIGMSECLHTVCHVKISVNLFKRFGRSIFTLSGDHLQSPLPVQCCIACVFFSFFYPLKPIIKYYSSLASYSVPPLF